MSPPVVKQHPLVAIVDDEECVLKALHRLLRSAGLNVETFAGGTEFLDSLPDHRPDCLILDIHMPGVTGFDVMAFLIAKGWSVPVIVITGHDSPEAYERAMAAHASAYLRKPIGDQMLLDVITAALRTPGGP